MEGNFSFQPNRYKAPDNADKISGNHIPGINRVVKLDIIIEGKTIKHFKHFRLQQSARRHHQFELTLAHDTLGEAQNHNLEEARLFLGKRITVVFKYKDYENESPERTFVGVITKAAFSQERMSLGNIVLKGHSPTILMDSAPHTQSFGGSQSVNTGIIADKIIKETLGSEKFDFRVDAQNKSYINYSSQYNETHYNYLARTAEAYGEQFYYDGEVLHFGKLPAPEKPVRLIYGSNATDVQIELKAVHTKPEFFGYNSSEHTKMTGSESSIRHLGEVPAKAYELNSNIFKARSLSPAPVNANMFMDVDDSQKSAAGSAAVEVFTVSGNTTVPFLYPGCTADIQMRKPDSNETAYFTKVTITETSHEVDARGYYKGSFEAIAEGTGFMPKPDFIIPNAEPQVATVISNTDPLNQGRIQVRFDWQRNPDTTHFIRMMSPDAGGTDAITQNRGFVAIPEVGDQVMVGFEYHHPDFPFAMGGMFHGQVALGGGLNNHIKSIQTRSGNKVIFNDKEGSIFIEDPSGNTYLMDGKGNITVTAPKNMYFKAGENIDMIAGKNFTLNAGENISNSANVNITSIAGTDIIQNAAGDIRETSDNRQEMAEKGIHRQSETSQSLAGKISMFSDKENMTLQSAKIIENNSADKAKLF
ncbi:Vgr family protein [Chryseobacterium artocarpi]|uniref:Vgr family protein n=1 Tax=Chryseobacterium artocarpi TaxID=1414727 RepID=A0A1B8ZZ89_9FLAO|nr:phage baseplate assembly protein V [Chryseobacterium artocarpi]OCA76917.1 Vgr family protein [Chryseobacterium artocarpi]